MIGVIQLIPWQWLRVSGKGAFYSR